MYNKNGKTYVSWEDAEHYIKDLIDLYERTNNKTKPCGVYGIPRGGLVLATMLSYRWNIPLLLAPMDGCIVIDDIADSGRTLLHFTENDTQFNKYYITTMFYHDRSIVKPNYSPLNKDDRWIVFPWEMKD